MMLKREKFVARPARHYFISYTIEEIFATCEVNGADIEAYACDRDRPTSACFKAPQSFAPSPHMETLSYRC
jgi:hypothetical protein